MEGTNGFIKIPFLIFYFMFSFKIGGLIYVFTKIYYHKIISKSSSFLYLFIGYLTDLIPLLIINRKGPNKVSRVSTILLTSL
jgi:hypothetical protein